MADIIPSPHFPHLLRLESQTHAFIRVLPFDKKKLRSRARRKNAYAVGALIL